MNKEFKERIEQIINEFKNYKYDIYLKDLSFPQEIQQDLIIANDLKRSAKYIDSADKFLAIIEKKRTIYPFILHILFFVFVSMGEFANGYRCLLNAKKMITSRFDRDPETGGKLDVIEDCDNFENVLDGWTDAQNKITFQYSTVFNKTEAELKVELIRRQINQLLKFLMYQSSMGKPWDLPNNDVLNDEYKECINLKRSFYK